MQSKGQPLAGMMSSVITMIQFEKHQIREARSEQNGIQRQHTILGSVSSPPDAILNPKSQVNERMAVRFKFTEEQCAKKW